MTYHWLHVTTGREGVRRFDEPEMETRRQLGTVTNERQALAQVNMWNNANPGVWQYWMTPDDFTSNA